MKKLAVALLAGMVLSIAGAPVVTAAPQYRTCQFCYV